MSGFGLGFGFAYVRSILSRVAATEIFTANVAELDGTSDYFTVSNDVVFEGGPTVTAGVWINRSNTQQASIIRKRPLGPFGDFVGWGAEISGGVFGGNTLYEDSAGNYVSYSSMTGTIPTTGLTLLIVEFADDSIKAWANDVDLGLSSTLTGSSLTGSINSGASLHLGSIDAIRYLKGKMLLPFVINRKLTVDERTSLFNSGVPKCWGLIASDTPSLDDCIFKGNLYNHTGFTGQELTDESVNNLTVTNISATPFTGSEQIECEEYVPSVNDMLMTIDTTQAGSASDTFIFPLTSMGGLASIQIAWGDGSSSVITSVGQAELTHVYAVGGTYDMLIIGAVGYEWLTSGATDKAKIITIAYSPNTTVIDLFNRQASSLTTVTGVPSLGISLRQVWQQSTSLTSIDFTGWDTSLISDWFFTFEGCTSLVSLPILDLTAITNASNTWLNCALDTTSIDNIMQSLVNSGKASLTTSVAGGTSLGFASWSAGAVTNYNTLISNGWTIATNA